jgi:hypothetical protein
MNPSCVLGIGSTATGLAVGAELVWYLENGKNSSAPANPIALHGARRVDKLANCKLALKKGQGLQFSVIFKHTVIINSIML